jgi:hypothetical protein
MLAVLSKAAPRRLRYWKLLPVLVVMLRPQLVLNVITPWLGFHAPWPHATAAMATTAATAGHGWPLGAAAATANAVMVCPGSPSSAASSGVGLHCPILQLIVAFVLRLLIVWLRGPYLYVVIIVEAQVVITPLRRDGCT